MTKFAARCLLAALAPLLMAAEAAPNAPLVVAEKTISFPKHPNVVDVTKPPYGAKGDVYRFYDINPGVVTIAQRDFTFLKDSDATIELALGDARLALEREPPQRFDVLAIDAFSSDAIPVHLITREAVEVYLRHLRPDGVIAYHVTNRYLNLVPVVEGIAHQLGLKSLWIDDAGLDPLGSSSSWVLLSREGKKLDDPRLAEFAKAIEPRRDWRGWTDDFNNLVQVLK